MMAGAKGGEWIAAGVTLGYLGWYAVLISRKYEGQCDWSWPKVFLFPVVMTLVAVGVLIVIIVIAKIVSAREYVEEGDRAEYDSWEREREFQRYERSQAPPSPVHRQPSWEEIKQQYGLTDRDYYTNTALKLRMGGPYTPSIY